MSLIYLFRTKLAATSWTRCKRNGNEAEPESSEGNGLQKIINLLIKTMFPMKLVLHTAVIDADVVHQASSEVNQTTSPQRSQDTTQRAQSTIQPNLPDYEVFLTEIKNETWGNISHESFCDTINGVYDEIAYFRRNILNVPSGRAGKAFIEELTFWIKQFNSNSDLNSVALKAFMVLPTLILQKPSATSKSKDSIAQR